ncbi:hypothetical protein [Phenylobacterium sp.]|jgi:hypothetical protein|uniref:hypothetical protein n=1 Tax=Phenylobacterium sp. TaxID=1871053 RepID=UPI002ED87109
MRSSTSRLGVFHCTLTGAVVLGLFFLLCWFGVAIADIPASRRMVGFFTTQELQSPSSIATGLGWAVLFGAVLGGLIALCFNTLGLILRQAKPR